MNMKDNPYECSHCGYTRNGDFIGDICPGCGLPFWKCSKCKCIITASIPPNVCPECGDKGSFVDVSCYISDCGGPGHLDQRLI